MYPCDDGKTGIGFISVCCPRGSLSASPLSRLKTIGLKSDSGLKSVGNKSMVMQDESSSIFLACPQDMASGDLVSMVSNNDPLDCHTPPENIGGNTQVSEFTLPRRIIPRKRKFDGMHSCESYNPIQKKMPA